MVVYHQVVKVFIDNVLDVEFFEILGDFVTVHQHVLHLLVSHLFLHLLVLISNLLAKVGHLCRVV